MNKTVVRVGVVVAILLPLGSLHGCFGLQRAAGCNNPGISGCKDKGPEPSEIGLPSADLKRAPPGGRAQRVPVGDGSYLAGHEYPWSRQRSFGVESVKANNRAQTECSPEQRDVDTCIEIYRPVCATVNVLCITKPCDPVQETFANSCEACMNPLVSAYTEGACPVHSQENAQVGYEP